jgi:hypothetical protein
MLPLTYFGAVGDNMTDNYGNIQVAIDESIKRGLRYIFVPNGTYYYSGNLLNVEQVIFIGNSKYATIYNDEKEIKIYQIGTQLPYEKGTKTIDEQVEEAGYIDIEVKTKNPSETILVINNKVIQVIDELILVDGKYKGSENIVLTDNTSISNIELLRDSIRIHYETMGEFLNVSIEWRVR